MREENLQFGPLRQLLTHGYYWRWSLAAQLLRLPSFMTAFGFVILSVYVTGNQILGGLMITVYVASSSLFSTILGRFIDRIGPSTGIPLLSLLAGATFSGLAVVAFVKGPDDILLVLSGLAGALSSGGGMRKLLDFIVPRSLIRTALSLDASLVEVTVATAPLVVAAVSVVSPVYSAVAMAFCCFGGALMVWTFKVQTSADVDHHSASTTTDPIAYSVHDRVSVGHDVLWRNRSFWFWLLVEFAFGHVFGTVETAILPWAVKAGTSVGEAGVALTILSICSGLGGLFYIRFAKKFTGRFKAEALGLLALIETGSLVLALSNKWIIGVAGMALIGLFTAPLNVVISTSAPDSMPNHRQSEGFAALGSVYTAGYGLGGLLLAVLPLQWRMLSAAATGILAGIIAPAVIEFT